MEDIINHPKHYELDKVECIDAMEMTQGRGAVMSFCLCNAFKYLWRHDRKNGLEDLKKAKWYLDKYLELAGRPEEDEATRLQDALTRHVLNSTYGIPSEEEEDSKPIKPIWTDQMTDAVKRKNTLRNPEGVEGYSYMDAPKELKDQFFMEMMKRASNDAPKEEVEASKLQDALIKLSRSVGVESASFMDKKEE